MGIGQTTKYECTDCGLRFTLGGFIDETDPPHEHSDYFSITHLVCAACGMQYWIKAEGRCYLYAHLEPDTHEARTRRPSVAAEVRLIAGHRIPPGLVEPPPSRLVGELVERPKERRTGLQILRDWLNSRSPSLMELFFLKCAFCGSEDGLTGTMTRPLRTCPHCQMGKMREIGGAKY